MTVASEKIESGGVARLIRNLDKQKKMTPMHDIV